MERHHVRDAKGRRWTISIVPADEAEEEDFRFWYEELTPEERVDLVDDCLASCLKTRGRDGTPRLRRVHRRVQRAPR